jgi:hypothetical protein
MEKGELEVVLDLPGHSNRSLGFVTKFGRGEEVGSRVVIVPVPRYFLVSVLRTLPINLPQYPEGLR